MSLTGFTGDAPSVLDACQNKPFAQLCAEVSSFCEGGLTTNIQSACNEILRKQHQGTCIIDSDYPQRFSCDECTGQSHPCPPKPIDAKSTTLDATSK